MNRVSSVLLTLLLVPLALFVATGLFDLFYVRYLVGQFNDGLAEVDFLNPHLGKALVSGVSAAAAFVYLRHFAASPAFIIRLVGFGTTTTFALGAFMHLIAGIATWGDYFDALGQSTLWVEVGYDNRLLYHYIDLHVANADHPRSKKTGLPLLHVTPENVQELEARRRAGKFEELTDPPENRWFAPGTGEPLLWYSMRKDGIHLFNMPGHDWGTKQVLKPVTLEIQEEYYRERGVVKQAAEDKKRAEEERKRTATLAVENTRLQEQLRVERMVATAATPIPMRKPDGKVASNAAPQNGYEAAARQGPFNLLEAIIGNMDRASQGSGSDAPPSYSAEPFPGERMNTPRVPPIRIKKAR